MSSWFTLVGGLVWLEREGLGQGERLRRAERKRITEEVNA
jgi:hypothetical protein